jgi:hypothetical protein
MEMILEEDWALNACEVAALIDLQAVGRGGGGE